MSEVDLKALEENIDKAMLDEPKPNGEDSEGEEFEEPEFDLDEILNSDQPFALEGVLTEEQAQEEAAKRGWKPEGKDRYGHQISAIEFLERAPLFNKINLMKGDIEELHKMTKKLAEQSKMIAQKSVEDKKKLNEELKAAKEKLLSSELLDTDDIEKLKTIDKQIEDINTEPEPEPDNNNLQARWEKAKKEFQDEHKSWYKRDYAMTTMADEVGVSFAQQYFEQNKVAPEPELVFEHVLGKLKEEFPDMGKPKPETQRRGKAVTSMQNRTQANKPSKKKTLNDIPEDQRAVAKEVMEAIPGMTEEEYLKTYKF